MRERTTLQDLLNQKIVYSKEMIYNQLQSDFNLQDNQERQVIDVLFKKGVEFLKSEKYCCASAFFETLLTFEPGNIKAELNLAVALSQIGDNKKALNILERVLEKEPDNEIARQNIDILLSLKK